MFSATSPDTTAPAASSPATPASSRLTEAEKAELFRGLLPFVEYRQPDREPRTLSERVLSRLD